MRRGEISSSSERRFVVIDTETTGLSPAYGHTLCEIALLTCEGNEVVDRYETLIRPSRPIPSAVSAIHGITNEMVKDAPRFFQIKEEILSLIKGTMLVLHNAPFDLGFIGAELAACGSTLPSVSALDTVLLTRKLYPGISHSLPNLTRYLGIPHAVQHRALGDTEATRDLFLICAREIAGEEWTIPRLIEFQGRAIEYHPSIPETSLIKIPEDFLAAIAEQKSVRILYQKVGHSPEWRNVSPYNVTYSDGTAYVEAFCRLRMELRRFRWDRILQYNVEGPSKE